MQKVTKVTCLSISDYFVFRPPGSMTAAIIAMLHTVRSMLVDSYFVHLCSFHFSKAFDTVRHATLMSKLAQLELPAASTTVLWTSSTIMPIALSMPDKYHQLPSSRPASFKAQ